MPQPSNPAQSPFGPADLALYAATVLIFSSGWLPLRFQLGVVAPEVSLVWRFLAATACMFAIAKISGARLAFPVRDHALFLVLGGSLFSLNFLAFYYAGFHLASGLLSVLFALSAVLIPLMSSAAARAWPRPRILIGAVLGVAGVCLVFGPVLSERGFGSGLHLGLLAGLAGALLFSFGSMMSMAVGRRRIPQASANAFGMAYGLALLAAIAVAKGDTFEVEWTARYLGALGYLILFPTLLGYAVYFRLISRIGASRAGYGTVVMPVVALLISSLVEDFHWTAAAALGIGLVLVGNVIVLGAGKAR
ncbi:MAG: DMT family transporter [Pseudomonadota bacterium]